MPIGFRNSITGLFKSYSSAGPGSMGEVPEGYEEVALQGPLTPEQVEPIPPTVAQQMDSVFRSLPEAEQAAFLPYKAAINLELQAENPNYNVIRLLIMGVPIGPSLQASRDLILSVLPDAE